MTDPENIPSGSRAVIDTSVLFAMGGPDNEKYRAFQRFVTRRNVSVRVPEEVVAELGDSPDAYAFGRERLRAAQQAGWLRSGAVDYADPEVSRVVDRTRQRMAKRSTADVSEDEIERADTSIAGLAYQYATGSATHVSILVSDRLAEAAIRVVLSARDVGDRTLVVEGRTFLDELTDDLSR